MVLMKQWRMFHFEHILIISINTFLYPTWIQFKAFSFSYNLVVVMELVALKHDVVIYIRYFNLTKKNTRCSSWINKACLNSLLSLLINQYFLLLLAFSEVSWVVYVLTLNELYITPFMMPSLKLVITFIISIGMFFSSNFYFVWHICQPLLWWCRLFVDVESLLGSRFYVFRLVFSLFSVSGLFLFLLRSTNLGFLQAFYTICQKSLYSNHSLIAEFYSF